MRSARAFSSLMPAKTLSVQSMHCLGSNRQKTPNGPPTRTSSQDKETSSAMYRSARIAKVGIMTCCSEQLPQALTLHLSLRSIRHLTQVFADQRAIVEYHPAIPPARPEPTEHPAPHCPQRASRRHQLVHSVSLSALQGWRSLLVARHSQKHRGRVHHDCHLTVTHTAVAPHRRRRMPIPRRAP